MDSNLNLNNPNAFIIENKEQIREITLKFHDIKKQISSEITVDLFLERLNSIKGLTTESIQSIKSYLEQHSNKEKFLESIQNKISVQLEQINNFLYFNCSEVSNSYSNIDNYQKSFDTNLNREVESKLNGIKTLTKNVLQLNDEKKNIYLKTNTDFFKTNNMPPFNYQNTIVLQKNGLENKKGSSESLIKKIVEEKENAALKDIDENIKGYKNIMNMQKDLYEEYKKIETDFIKQIHDFNCFENARNSNQMEKMLIEENILF